MNYQHISYTVELQWLKQLWNHENMFEIGVVQANENLSYHQVRNDIFSIFVNMKEDTIYHFQYKKEKQPILFYSYGIFSKGLKNEFETVVENEPLVFEPLSVYSINILQYICIYVIWHLPGYIIIMFAVVQNIHYNWI